jgi:hypothetical protein
MSQSLRELSETVVFGSSAIWKIVKIEQYLSDVEKLSKKARTEFRLLCRYLATDIDASERMGAVELLGNIGNRNDSFAIKQACSDPEMMVRCAAVSALASLLGKKAFPFLRDLQFDIDPNVRRWTYTAIYDTGHEAAIDWLRNRLECETEPIAQIGILGALHETGDQRFSEMLVAFTNDPNPRIKNLAIDSLAATPNIREKNVSP